MLHAWVKPGGHLLLTVPYGWGNLSGAHVYVETGLSKVLSKFKVLTEEYYYKSGGKH